MIALWIISYLFELSEIFPIKWNLTAVFTQMIEHPGSIGESYPQALKSTLPTEMPPAAQAHWSRNAGAMLVHAMPHPV